MKTMTPTQLNTVRTALRHVYSARSEVNLHDDGDTGIVNISRLSEIIDCIEGVLAEQDTD